jgi:broad specificity phosphatase PhoE
MSSVRFYGSTDIALSELGAQQVRALESRLRQESFAALVHSPLSRARRSAEILHDCLHSPPAEEHVFALEAFREIDFGDIEGMSMDEIQANMPDWHGRWRAGEVEGFPGGEVIKAFRDRVAAGFDEILERYPRGNLLCVVHKGVINSALQHLLGWSEADTRAQALDLGSLSILEIGTQSRVTELNCRYPESQS